MIMIIIISLFYIISYHAFININHNYYHHNIIIYHSIKNNNKNNNNNNVGIDSYITPRVRKQSKRDKTFVNILDSINYNRASSSSASSSSLIENNIDNIKNDPLIPLVEKIVKAADMRFIHIYIYTLDNLCVVVSMYRCIDGWMDGWIDGWID